MIGIRMVVPPLAFKESEMRLPTAAASVVVEVDVSPLGVTTLDGASFPLGSAQLIPRKGFVFASKLRGVVAAAGRMDSFLEQPANRISEQMTWIRRFDFI